MMSLEGRGGGSVAENVYEDRTWGLTAGGCQDDLGLVHEWPCIGLLSGHSRPSMGLSVWMTGGSDAAAFRKAPLGGPALLVPLPNRPSSPESLGALPISSSPCGDHHPSAVRLPPDGGSILLPGVSRPQPWLGTWWAWSLNADQGVPRADEGSGSAAWLSRRRETGSVTCPGWSWLRLHHCIPAAAPCWHPGWPGLPAGPP